jgi:hypothetical protein
MHAARWNTVDGASMLGSPKGVLTGMNDGMMGNGEDKVEENIRQSFIQFLQCALCVSLFRSSRHSHFTASNEMPLRCYLLRNGKLRFDSAPLVDF